MGEDIIASDEANALNRADATGRADSATAVAASDRANKSEPEDEKEEGRADEI